jgi:phosphohistidine phosphatase
MTKTIYLIRHSKASREFPHINDIDRPLTEKGCLDADKMSHLLKSHIDHLDIVISSPSVRTYSTALIYARNLNYPLNNIVLERKIYMAGSRDLFSVIKQTENHYNNVALFAHNPGLERLVKLLTAQDHLHFATSGFAIIETATDQWSKIENGSCKLITYRQPKESVYN